MNPEEFRSRRELCDKYGIRFLGPVQPDRWPERLEKFFSDVVKLGDRKICDFVESITVDSIDKPWRGQTAKRAKRLASLAELCRVERRNERGWRSRIEHEVLHRFSVEVAW
jgi:hypothetical protein